MNEQDLKNELDILKSELLKKAEAAIPLKIKIGIAVLLFLLICAVAFGIYKHFQDEEAILMNEQQVKSAADLQQKLKVSEQTAQQLQEEILKAQSKPPVVSYTVTAPTIQAAAEKEQSYIKEGKSEANRIPADKTVVVPNETQQKVDVYRITLDKARLGINAIVIAGNGSVEIGIGPSWKNRDNAVNVGYTSEKRYYGMWVRYF